MKRRHLPLILCIILTLTLSPILSFGSSGVVDEEVNGQFILSILQGEEWIVAGSLDFGRFYGEKQINIGDFIEANGELSLKVTKIGGGSSHLDAVVLENKAPILINEGSEKDLAKLLKADFDVVNVDEDGLILSFNTKPGDKILKVYGRIEKEVISKVPFTFPSNNSEFYKYTLDSRRITPLNILEDLQGDEPFLKEFCLPGSGHPQGYIYGWVANDDENLYVAIDLTSDNTLDGDKDYAKVNINTDEGLKTFEITQSNSIWGRTAFVYTDKVEYEHKIYEFVIPLDDMGSGLKDLFMSFTVYGTLSDPIVIDKRDVFVTEGTDDFAVIGLSRDLSTEGDYPGDVTVSYLTVDGNAIDGEDYFGAAGAC